MPTLKFLLSLFLGLTVVFAQVGAVYAAPPQQDGASLTGTVKDLVVEASPESGLPTVVITLLVDGEIQLVRVSVETAVDLGLIALDQEGNPILDEDGNPVVDDTLFETDIEIDPTTIIPEISEPEEKQHPVGAKITELFSGMFDVDYELVMSSHSNGFGFGVIAQASWMTETLGGDATLFQTILDAKKNHDYTGVALPDGVIPQNWGQLKNAVLPGEDNQNLGDVVSGGNDKPDNSGNENGHETTQGQSKDKDDDHNWWKDKPEMPPGQMKEKDDNGNGNNPVTPPGQSKDKDKDKDNNGNSGNPPGQNKDKDNNGKTK